MTENKNFWDRYALDFDAIYGTKNSWINTIINKMFRGAIKIRFAKTISEIPEENVSVLDIGCGPGHYCFALAKKVSGEILGIDFSQNMVNLAVRHTEEINLENNPEFRVMDVLEFNPDKKYDYVIMMGFIEYFEEPEVILRKAISLTNKQLFISFPVAGGLLAFQRRLRYKRKCFLRLYHYTDISALMDKLNVQCYNIEKIQRDFFVTITLS
jgi:2-polyprenyl-3-methyl-5-hydroxy-6-metoxy-1,4-benzoquinol methylase